MRTKFLLLLCAGITFAMAQTVMLPMLPAIAKQLHASPAAASWLITGFLLAASVGTPVVGKLGDVYGRGWVLGGVMTTFSLGSAVCAVGGAWEY